MSESNHQFEFIQLAIPIAADFNELIEKIIAKLPDERINLLGFSLGGYLAAHIAMIHPERVSRLMVIANSPCQLNAHELIQLQQVLNFIEQFGYNGMGYKKAASMVDDAQVHADVIDTLLQMDAKLGKTTLVNQLEITSYREDLALPLSKLTMPISFYYSEADSLINKTWINGLSKHQHISVYCTSGKGHMLPLEKPKELLRVIEQWV
ncbi:alpha/beta hydrolase [Parashewanella spongiae]|uniref:alpha/beta fold hydrolase n=1 Tax=Parashewanella spongiae TaxID=342950 RepID=UPI0014049DD0|nr:alpha/beta hydrolase [Parashewanella spongiae]MCL1078545.1 alpha/beta hydrolase [Parashewanella spongiae]